MSNMSFTELLREWNSLAHGAEKIMLPEGLSIEGLGQALEEQREDVTLVLSNLPKEVLEELEVAVAQAADGCVQAGSSFASLKQFGKDLSEAEVYEMPKIGDAINRLGRNYENLGQTFTHLLMAVRAARQLEAQG